MAQEKNGGVAGMLSNYAGWYAKHMLEEASRFYSLGLSIFNPVAEDYATINSTLVQISIEMSKFFYRSALYDTKPIRIPFTEKFKAEKAVPPQYTAPLEGIPQAEAATNVQTNC